MLDWAVQLQVNANIWAPIKWQQVLFLTKNNLLNDAFLEKKQKQSQLTCQSDALLQDSSSLKRLRAWIIYIYGRISEDCIIIIIFSSSSSSSGSSTEASSLTARLSLHWLFSNTDYYRRNIEQPFTSVSSVTYECHYKSWHQRLELR